MASKRAISPTPLSLLMRLKESSRAEDWAQFVDIYGPVIYGWARRRRLQPQDAADLTQDVLAAVVRSIGRWQQEPTRGRFRDWLGTITRNKLVDFWRAEQRRPRASGESSVLELLHQLKAPESVLDRDWDESYLGEVLARALARLRPQFSEKTFRAFERLVFDEKAATAVAAELGMSLNAVYVAKSRVLARLRTELEGLID